VTKTTVFVCWNMFLRNPFGTGLQQEPNWSATHGPMYVEYTAVHACRGPHGGRCSSAAPDVNNNGAGTLLLAAVASTQGATTAAAALSGSERGGGMSLHDHGRVGGCVEGVAAVCTPRGRERDNDDGGTDSDGADEEAVRTAARRRGGGGGAKCRRPQVAAARVVPPGAPALLAQHLTKGAARTLQSGRERACCD
jgi:hypothetical protein